MKPVIRQLKHNVIAPIDISGQGHTSLNPIEVWTLAVQTVQQYVI
jgi:hypothetical protein